MKELIRKQCSTKFSEEYLAILGDSLQAKIAKALNYYPITFDGQDIKAWLKKRGEEELRKNKHVAAFELVDDFTSTANFRVWETGWLSLWRKNFCMWDYWHSCQWVETEFKKYPNLVPESVVLKYHEAAQLNIFDNICVATKEHVTRPVTADPLLVGRVKDSDLRFFIAQWDSDIVLDDILPSKE